MCVVFALKLNPFISFNVTITLMNGFCFNVNTIGIPNVRTAPWNMQHIKDLKMTEWSVETLSPIISGNKYCADVNNWLIISLSNVWSLSVSNQVRHTYESHTQTVIYIYICFAGRASQYIYLSN